MRIGYSRKPWLGLHHSRQAPGRRRLFNHAVGGNATTTTAAAVYAEVSRELCPLVVETIMGALRHNANGALIREAVVAEINAFLQVLLDPAFIQELFDDLFNC